MQKVRRRNRIILTVLVGILFLMAVGYSAFSSVLDIKGTSSVTSKWLIKITNVELEELTGETEEAEAATFDDLNAYMNVNFYTPGDSVKYAVTVANEGTLNAVLDSIKINTGDTTIVDFKVEGINSGDALNAGDSTTFYVTFKYDETVTSQPDETSFNITTELNYLQEDNSTNFSDADSDTIDSLSITGIVLDPDEYKIVATVSATEAVKYYYSIDNDKWYESTNSSYTLLDLKPNTEYTVYIKAESESGEVVVSSAKTTTLDNTDPVIKIEEKEIVTGDNGWDTSAALTSTVTDNDAVKEVLYCTTTEDSCTPDTEATLSGDTFDYIFESSSSEQKLCVSATDKSGNSSTECSNAYLVDNEVPTVNGVTITPDDDTMLVEIDVTDKYSGAYTYYYSKDGGSTYTESSNANYTFTSLDEGDYLINVYVKDKAGNTSTSKAGTTTIRHKSWCEKQGITDLAECAIATEAGESDIATAKSTIEAKGTPTFTSTSPAIVYEEVASTALSTVTSTLESMYIGTGYTFDTTTGMYQITGGSLQDPSSLDYSSTTYYTLLTNWNTTSSTMYKISGVTYSTATTGLKTYTLTKYNYTQNIVSYDTSEVGMYASTDDDGTTYYYRGSVGGNYVKLGNYYFRIIRINGDGTVRMIYDGTSAHSNGEASSNRQIGTSAFNSYWNDNAYVGYMYGDVSNFTETDSGSATFTYTGLSSTAKYYFADSYTLDTSTRSFKLSGNIISGTLGTDKVGYYTCFSTSETGTCQRLLYTTKYASSTSMVVKGKEFGSTSYSDAFSKVTNSTIKNKLDTWYTSNMTSYADMLSSDTTYCNNKTISTHNSGTYTNAGYGITPTIYGYERFYAWNGSATGPTLSCPDDDEYSVSNGSLTYPIGLITADEVNMAGGKTGSVNLLYYLYSGTYYWTMSPSRFYRDFDADELYVSSSGFLASNWSGSGYGVRPVFNLKSEDLVVTGTGTKEDPFEVSSETNS